MVAHLRHVLQLSRLLPLPLRLQYSPGYHWTAHKSAPHESAPRKFTLSHHLLLMRSYTVRHLERQRQG